MGKLIGFELHKLFRQKSFYVCSAILLLVTVFLVRGIWNVRADMGLYGGNYAQESMINSGSTFLFIMLLGVFAALFICDDYSGGTIRVIISRGYSRTQIYFAKLIVLCIGSLMILLLCWFSAFFTARAVNNGVNTSADIYFPVTLFAQMLIIIAYVCLFNAIASATQKNGGAIALCIILPTAVSLILGMVESTLNRGSIESQIEISKYWLDLLLSEVSVVEPSKATLKLALMTSPLYIIGTTVLGWISIIKREY